MTIPYRFEPDDPGGLRARPHVEVNEPPDLSRSQASLENEYGFLVPGIVGIDALRFAIERAVYLGVPVQMVLVRGGFVDANTYVAALEDHILGIMPHTTGGGDRSAVKSATGEASSVWIHVMNERPSRIAAIVRDARWRGLKILLAASDARVARLDPELETRHGEQAAWGFSQRFPLLSAAMPVPVWQKLSCAILAGLIIGGSLVAPRATLFATSAILALLFAIIVGVRMVALFIVLQAGPSAPGQRANGRRIDDRNLPDYTIIAPLYKEAGILRDLVGALEAIDYPTERLDIILVLEHDDRAAVWAANGLRLPPHFRVIVVPCIGPKTKPKALNYALGVARGRFVVIYDAEDVPEPDQLRKAAARFLESGDSIACLQAKLNTYNPADSWLSRQFALEYTALFDGFLPALARLSLPLPLGGTSNHFPVKVLRRAGGWDAFNVTEDADLGFRIARISGRIEMLESTTWEEAPSRLMPWFRQRTRWLKGWMVTYLVHMRDPGRLLRALGMWRYIGFQVVLGGMLLSTLIHPIFYILLAAGLWSGFAFVTTHSLIGDVLVALAAGNLAAGYLSAILLAATSVARRGRRWLICHLLTMPVYWLLISLASYRALWQAIRDPYKWEKTPHRPRTN